MRSRTTAIRGRQRTWTCSFARARANAARVYKALAAFGAPLDQFEVGETDFVTYDGVLQIGLPPRRIDILNRADGITFDEAIEANESFEVDGRRIAIIGLAALLKNKRAAAREQDLADAKALEAIAERTSR